MKNVSKNFVYFFVILFSCLFLFLLLGLFDVGVIKLKLDSSDEYAQAANYKLYTVDESRGKTTVYDMSNFVDNPFFMIEESSSEIYIDDLYLTSPAAREGYKFLGWKAREASIILFNEGWNFYDNMIFVEYDDYFNFTSYHGYGLALWGNVKDLYLYAEWEKQFITVTFDANGGSIPSSSNWSGSGSSATKNVNIGSSYGTIPAPTKTGYDFEGWFTLASGGSKITDSSSLISSDDHKLYAHWSVKSYTVTANPNGGTIGSQLNGWTLSGSSATKSIDYGSVYGTFPGVSRIGYVLQGWYTASSGGTVVSTSTAMQKNYNHTIYAHWKIKNYTITFNYDGGRVGSSTSQSQSVTYNSTCTCPIPTKTGFILTGWKCSYNGNTYSVNSNDKSCSITIPDLGTDGNENAVFTAQWQPISYSIRFNANGGEGSSYTQQGIKYKKDTESGDNLIVNRFIKEGYSFKGWSMNSNATEATYSDGQEIKNLTAVDGAIIDLYAIWAINNYEIELKVNGGTFPQNMSGWSNTGGRIIKSVEYNAAIGYLPKPIMRGFIFLGWFTDKDELILENTKMRAGNIILTAKWQKTWAEQNIIDEPAVIDDVYQVSSAENLAWIASQLETRNVNFSVKQTASISLNGRVWLPIGNSQFAFQGEYDGQGYTISGLNVIDAEGQSSQYQGLFGNVNGENSSKKACIKNIRLLESSVAGESIVGGLIGSAGNAEIINCSSNAEMSAVRNAGGLIGETTDNVLIRGCYCYGILNATGENIGGLVGVVNGINLEIKNSLSKLKLFASGVCGGLIGGANQTVKINSCLFEGSFNVTGGNVGAFIGRSNVGGEIRDCYANVNGVTNLNLYNGNASAMNCILELNGNKNLIGSDFSNWTTLKNGQYLPKGLAWSASFNKS